MTDNTSFFIAADFDEENWQDAILKLHKTCLQYELPTVIERSRSGNGGHLWLFFEENIPAFQSRKIMFSLLREAEIISKFEKEPSFDRLFPNQDTHSGKAIGNLIALPLQGNSLTRGNSCFVDPQTFEPYPNQWVSLQSIQKVSKQKIESLYLQLSGTLKETFSTEPSDYVWVSISDMGKNGMYIDKSSEYLTQKAVEKFNVRIIPSNTVILSFKLTVGRVAISDGEITSNEAIAHFKTEKDNLTEFLYYYLKIFNFHSLGSTSSIAIAVNSKIVKSIPIQMPPKTVLSSFGYLVKPIMKKIKSCQNENKRLSQLRDTLLPKLMSGELSVDDI